MTRRIASQAIPSHLEEAFRKHKRVGGRGGGARGRHSTADRACPRRDLRRHHFLETAGRRARGTSGPDRQRQSGQPQRQEEPPKIFLKGDMRPRNPPHLPGGEGRGRSAPGGNGGGVGRTATEAVKLPALSPAPLLKRPPPPHPPRLLTPGNVPNTLSKQKVTGNIKSLLQLGPFIFLSL